MVYFSQQERIQKKHLIVCKQDIYSTCQNERYACFWMTLIWPIERDHKMWFGLRSAKKTMCLSSFKTNNTVFKHV